MTNKKDKTRASSYPQKKSNTAQQLMEHGKIPPQAVDLEEAVLGACLLEKGAYDEIAHILDAECFYLDKHQRIFQSIARLAAAADPVDILTVTNDLKQTGELEMVGGPYYITTLTSRIASTANIQFHAMIMYQKHIQRMMISTCSELINYAYEDEFDDMRTFYSVATERIDSLLAGRRGDRSMLQIMKDYMVDIDNRIKLARKGEQTGIVTGLVHLNKFTNGWKPGELIIVAGRPGMGKTAVALNLFAKSAAKKGKNVLFFSLEMTDIRLADRLICSYGGINPNNLRSGHMSDEELSRMNESAVKLQQLPIYIDDTARADVKHITAISRAKRRKGQCDMVVIDYLQLIETHNENNWQKNREREVAEMSRSLKLMSKELELPVILLAQLNRSVETRSTVSKKPLLSDLRESGAIEQDADVVIFPYRPEVYGITEDDEGNSTKNVTILSIAKNREGRIGDVFAKNSEDLTQFFDYESIDTPF